jgi:hypothetical protein
MTAARENMLACVMCHLLGVEKPFVFSSISLSSELEFISVTFQPRPCPKVVVAISSVFCFSE